MIHFSILEVEMHLRELQMVDLDRPQNLGPFVEIELAATPEVSNNFKSNSHIHLETGPAELERSSRNKARPSRVHRPQIGCLDKAARTR